jgi:hypothetical protein
VFNTASYGNCFTFNTVLNTDADSLGGKRISSMTGPKFGLSLVLDLQQDAYLINGYTTQVESGA